MILFFLAAGEGTRFRPHTEVLPKPALPFCGVPLIYYSYFLAKCLQPSRLVINTYHLPDEIRKIGNSLSAITPDVKFSDEKEHLLGSAGGMAKAREYLSVEEDFIAINADEVIIPLELNIMRDFYQFAKSQNYLSVLMVMKHPEAGKKFGAVWANSKGEVFGFGKTPPQSSEELLPYHFIGPMYFKNRIFSRLKEEPSNILHDVLTQAIREGDKVIIFPIECEWFETGNLEDYLLATKKVVDLIQEQNPFLLEMKSQLKIETELVVTPQAKILKHHSAFIDPTSEISGTVVLGAKVHLSAGVTIRDSVVSDNIKIESNRIVERSLVLN